jgi:hypothetical protein
MEDHIRLILFFIVGMTGAAIYLFILDQKGELKTVKTKSRALGLKLSALIFILVGGLVTLMYESSLNAEFVLTQIWAILLVGFGWQALFNALAPNQTPVTHGEEKPSEVETLKARVNELERASEGRKKKELQELDNKLKAMGQ